MPYKVRGDSGSDVTQSTDDKVVIVGAHPNLMPSCRTDGSGKARTNLTASETQGMMEIETSRTEYESVDNAGDHHGGCYSVVAMNRYTVDAAAGGITLNSAGGIDVLAGGGLINLVATEAVTGVGRTIFLSSTEITVLEGAELYVNTDNTSFINNVRLAKNLQVKGSVYVNGELFVNSITAPLEDDPQKSFTEDSGPLGVQFYTGATLSGVILGTLTTATPIMTTNGPAIPNGAIVTLGLPDPSGATSAQFVLDTKTIQKPQGFAVGHTHVYKHPKWRLKESNTEVWEESTDLNENKAVPAKMNESFLEGLPKKIAKVMKKTLKTYLDGVSESVKNYFGNAEK